MSPILSILIATLPERQEMFDRLSALLRPQLTGNVEIRFDAHPTDSIGVKRQRLLEAATGKYIVFIDDDDTVSANYVALILNACTTGADCIGIRGHMTTNGGNLQKWFISKVYGCWHTKDNAHYRTPNHISPVKRELALKAGFPPIAFGEDHAYSMALLPLLKTETLIKHPLYFYDYRTNK